MMFICIIDEARKAMVSQIMICLFTIFKCDSNSTYHCSKELEYCPVVNYLHPVLKFHDTLTLEIAQMFQP